LQNKRSQWKNQYFEIESASILHNNLREIFISDNFFKNLKCFQEVPVAALVPSYKHNSHKVDWYIDELGIVIEVHGKQHYQMQNFGNSPYMDALKDFNNIRYRDNMKKSALIDAEYQYVEIHYKIAKKINAKILKELIFGDRSD
jgi:hypothetical protein